ncbi:morphogenic membrane protein MmpA [Streptomyces sp. NPDC101118]
MTTRHRAPKPEALPAVERTVLAGLVVAGLAGAGWLGSMIYTLVSWSTG